MRISELVKTYRFINDPDAPPWSVKFVHSIGIIVLVGAAVGGLYLATREDPAATAPGAVGATDGSAGPLLHTYVGLPEGTPVTDARAADAALAEWRLEHPGATIASQQPVASPAGGVVGYRLAYREAA